MGIEPTLVREMAVPGKARIDYRDFAFLGKESTDAAVAARCAEREGLFWRYHDLLYASQSGENQGAFARDRLLGLATFAGIVDTPAFTACLDDPAVAGQVAAETADGRSYGIEVHPDDPDHRSGPTQVLNGVKDPAEIAAAFDKASTPAPDLEPGPILEHRPRVEHRPGSEPRPEPVAVVVDWLSPEIGIPAGSHIASRWAAAPDESVSRDMTDSSTLPAVARARLRFGFDVRACEPRP